MTVPVPASLDPDDPSALIVDPDASAREREEREREQMKALAAKPWRGMCPFCPGRNWCTDTDEEARGFVKAHMDAEHEVPVPIVWRDH